MESRDPARIERPMDYHAIHGHDVANFGTPGRPGTRRVLTVSAADVDDALLSPAEDDTATGAEGTAKTDAEKHGRIAAARNFVSTGLSTLDGVLAGVLPSATADAETAAVSDSEDGDDTGLDDGCSQPRKRRRTYPARHGTTPAIAGGVRRGQLTEIWGPPGAGKTTFGMQLVANALRDGGRAVWIDCATPLCSGRLSTIVDAQRQQTPSTDPSIEPSIEPLTKPSTAAETTAPGAADALVRYVCPSLPHWIALLCTPPAAATPRHPPWLPPGTSLLVIDALSALVNYALPRTAEGKVPLMANGKKGPHPYEKRTQVLQYITAALERLAESCHLAVVVLTQCASRVGGGGGRNNAGLAPALNAVVWDRAIAARLVLFRDWAWVEEADEEAAADENKAKLYPKRRKTTGSRPVGGRFVGVQKVGRAGLGAGGIDSSDAITPGSSSSGVEQVVGFDIHETGLVEVPYSTQPPQGASGGRRKRVADDEDSDYGWGDDDSMPRMPPQWQGSEDLLLGRVYGEDEEDEEGLNEEEETEDRDEKHDDETEEPRATPGMGNDIIGTRGSLDVLDVLSGAWPPPRSTTGRRGSHSVADSEDDEDI